MYVAQQAQNLPLPLRHAIQELGVAVANITKCKYTSVAGLTVVIYDLLLLLPDEIRLVWQRSRMAPSRIAYFVNRYVPPIFLLVANYQLGGFRGPLTNEVWVYLYPAFSEKPDSPVVVCSHCLSEVVGLPKRNNSCRYWLATSSLVQVFTCTCATYILVLRVLALYRAGRAITITIYVLFAISYGACLGITVEASIVLKRNAFFDPLVHICNTNHTPRIFKFIFLTPIFFEILIGALTLWKCIQHAYLISNTSSAPMIYIILRDGLIWWTLVIGLRVWNALVWVFLPQSLIYLGIYVHWALISTAVSRFFLNILDVRNPGMIDGFSTAYVTVREQEVDAARKGMLTFGANSTLETSPQVSLRDEYEFDEFCIERDRIASGSSPRGETSPQAEVA
ncbi:hypothetical protein FRC20_001052 [Serendipita sp. 405]|nr:hypothetical protein FRC20_001052 [Serendipita sp. 405]